MTKKATFELPWPPSVNALRAVFGGRIVTTKLGRQFYQDSAKYIQAQRVPDFGIARLRLLVTAYPPISSRKRDLGNIDKALQDALVKAGVFVDDEQIDEMIYIRAEQSGRGFVAVTIEEI